MSKYYIYVLILLLKLLIINFMLLHYKIIDYFYDYAPQIYEVLILCETMIKFIIWVK